jgi:flagellar biosynthetic protein FliR
MLLLNIPLDKIQLFLFVLVRVAAILFSIPFLEARNIPFMIKASLVIAASLLIVPNLNTPAQTMLNEPLSLILGLTSEVAVGLIIGLTIQLLFTGVQLAGQMGGFQMGLAIANVVDPNSSLQIPLLAQFLNLFTMMLFLSLNIHHYFIKAMVEGFELIPPWGAHFNGDLFRLVMHLTANAFIIAVKVGAPVMVSLLLTSVALGLMARTVPQMQIFIVAMPLKILLGLIFMGVSLPFCSTYLQSALVTLGQTVERLIRIFM